MIYDFDTPVNRRNTSSLKWDVSENELPMWVADMDFKTAPEIHEAIKQRAESGIFGYTVIPKEWQEAYAEWWRKRHGFEMQKEYLIFCTGVVPAISSIVRKLTTPAEKVLIQTPVYNIFFNSIINNGRQVLECPLGYDSEAAEYSINFDELEKKLSDPQTSLMILCNPHNPIGKIWDKDTLSTIGELCLKHNVTVISDEIHCDLTDPGLEYIPFASVSDACRDNSITCIAPTKTFNLAGIQTAAVYIPNPVLRHKVWRGLNTDEVAEPNFFAADAAAAAYKNGEKWLDQLRNYIYDNKNTVYSFIKKEIPNIKAVFSQATYLIWIDCTEFLSGLKPDVNNENSAAEIIRRKSGLYLSSGGQFGGNGKNFVRMNVACPRSFVEEGLNRLKMSLQV